MRFDWDPAKADRNLEKHGVRLEEAITAFDDPYALVAPDPEHSTTSELREEPPGSILKIDFLGGRD